MRIYFSVRPKIERLDQVKSWLKSDFDEGEIGFYSNWNVIEKSYDSGNFYCLTSGDCTLAFCTYYIVGYVAYIETIEVNKKYRGRSVGKIFIDKIIKRFKVLGVMVIELESVFDSLSFWLKVGFSELHENVKSNEYEKRKKLLYKPIVESLKSNSDLIMSNIIELWDISYWGRSDGIQPKWKWSILLIDESFKLKIPIIIPANRSWRIRWIKDNKIIKESLVKCFSHDSLCWGDYVILTDLQSVEANS